MWTRNGYCLCQIFNMSKSHNILGDALMTDLDVRNYQTCETESISSYEWCIKRCLDTLSLNEKGLAQNSNEAIRQRGARSDDVARRLWRSPRSCPHRAIGFSEVRGNPYAAPNDSGYRDNRRNMLEELREVILR